MGKKNKFLTWVKINWDVFLMLFLPLLGLILTFIAGKNCHGGLECLGIIGIFVIGILLSIIFLLISIARQVFNKKLKQNITRWSLIILASILYLFLLIYLKLWKLIGSLRIFS